MNDTKGEKRRTIRDVIAAQKSQNIAIPGDPHVTIESAAISQDIQPLQDEDGPHSSIAESQVDEEFRASLQNQDMADYDDMVEQEVNNLLNAMLASDTKYDNSRRTVSLDKSFKDILDTVAQFCRIDVSQVLNNILSYYFRNGKFSEVLMAELLRRIQKKQQHVLAQSFRNTNKRR